MIHICSTLPLRCSITGRKHSGRKCSSIFNQPDGRSGRTWRKYRDERETIRSAPSRRCPTDLFNETRRLWQAFRPHCFEGRQFAHQRNANLGCRGFLLLTRANVALDDGMIQETRKPLAFPSRASAIHRPRKSNEWALVYHHVCTSGWSATGASLPKTRAIFCTSAHWHILKTAVTSILSPRTLPVR